MTAAHGRDYHAGEFGDGVFAIPRGEEGFAIGAIVGRGREQGVNGIVDVQQIAALLPFAVDRQVFPRQRQADEVIEHAAVAAADVGPGAKYIGEPDNGRLQIVGIVIDEVILLGDTLVGRINVPGVFGVFLVDGLAPHLAALGAGAGVDYPRVGIALAEGLQQVHRADAVDLDIEEGVAHGIAVGRVAGAVEDDVLLFERGCEELDVADIVDLVADAIFVSREICEIPTALAHEGVVDRDGGAQFAAADGEVGPDESQSPEYQNAFTG